jgi:hypothetical protein
MSRNGSGTYNLPSGNPVVTGTTITSTWANSTLTDIANALTGSVASDGQTPMSGSLNMGANQITNVADPTTPQSAATKSYVDGATGVFLLKASNLSDVADVATSRGNLSAAKSGANSDITSLSGLTTALSIAQGGTGATTLAGANIAVTTAANTFTGTQTFNGTSSTKAMNVLNIAEATNIVASAPSATTNFYLNSGSVQYYTSNTTTNFTLNIAFSSGTSLNTAMAVGDTVTVTLMVTNGSTAYYPSTIQIDGSSVTPKWQNGTAVAAGNPSSIDVYCFAIIKTASATYTVVASQSKFA